MKMDLFNCDLWRESGLWLCIVLAGAVALVVGVTYLIVGLFRWVGWVDAHFR